MAGTPALPGMRSRVEVSWRAQVRCPGEFLEGRLVGDWKTMAHFILGRKGRMTQVFTEDGRCIPVTILEAGPCTIVQVKSKQSDGYDALQLAYEPVREKVLTLPENGHFKKAGVAPHRFLREMRLNGPADAQVGGVITCNGFETGSRVDVIGTIKGRGTAGVMKRHNFRGRPASHGHMRQRRPGSIGMHTEPARVFKGKRMAGHYGCTRQTMQNLEVVAVDPEHNLMMVRGAVPGPRGGFIMIRSAKTAPASAGKKD